jgi:O-antigen/teichoic acid export membrane protein
MFFTVLKRMLAFGLPTLPHSIFSLLAAWGDRWILIRFCGSAIAGVYAAAGQSIFVINFVGSVANLAWTPWLYTHLSSRRNLLEQRPRIVRSTYMLGGILAGLGIVIFFCLWAYFQWAAPLLYRSAIRYLPWLALGAIGNAVYKVGTSFLFFYGRTRYLAVLALIVLLQSIGAQWLLVPYYQGDASAIVFAGVNLVQMTAVWHMASRLYLNPVRREDAA